MIMLDKMNCYKIQAEMTECLTCLTSLFLVVANVSGLEPKGMTASSECGGEKLLQCVQFVPVQTLILIK